MKPEDLHVGQRLGEKTVFSSLHQALKDDNPEEDSAQGAN